MEIGSIYEMNPKLLENNGGEILSGQELGETKKYGKKYIGYTASGREAIALALESIARNRPDNKKSCLLPAYMCDTVFFPLQRAGWEMHFYEIEKNLEAKKDILCHKIENIRPGLLFIHAYYGVDTWKPMRSLLNEWKKQGICIMEDVTQSYYLPEIGKEADYVVGSLRKWYPVPDGGFVASDIPLPEETLPTGSEFTQKRIELLVEKWNYLHRDEEEEKSVQKADYLRKNREMEKWLDDFPGINGLSPAAAGILKNIDEEACSNRRNANYAYLSENIRGSHSFTPVFTEEIQVNAPLYFPIYARDREELQEFLRVHDIYAPVLWPIGEENKNSLTESEEYIFTHMLALPIDQRYGSREMERIVAVLREYDKDVEAHEEVIGIRADANEQVATGHVMRCITIARQLKRCGKKVVFFTADQYAHDMLDEAGMDDICLQTKWNRMEEETDRLLYEMKKAGCRKLLVDSYQVTKGYFEKLKKDCTLIYIDDCFEEIYPVDMIINYNAFYRRFPYSESYEKNKEKGRETRLLLGTRYVPLREEFSTDKDIFPKKDSFKERGKSNVLLASGGGDTYNALAGILTAFMKEDIIFHVIVGRFNKNEQELQKLAEENSNIRLHYDVKNVAELMNGCEAAVSAAGTMLFELCAMQIPTVFFVSADNQKYDSEFFSREERMLFGGDMRRGRESCLVEISRQLERLLMDKELQQRMRMQLGKVTDGKGARRIAEEIAAL